MFDFLGIDGARSVVVDLLMVIVDRLVFGGGLRLDLHRRRRLLGVGVAHVGSF